MPTEVSAVTRSLIGIAPWARQRTRPLASTSTRPGSAAGSVRPDAGIAAAPVPCGTARAGGGGSRPPAEPPPAVMTTRIATRRTPPAIHHTRRRDSAEAAGLRPGNGPGGGRRDAGRAGGRGAGLEGRAAVL